MLSGYQVVVQRFDGTNWTPIYTTTTGAMMIAHHQGAIDMARAELRHVTRPHVTVEYPQAIAVNNQAPGDIWGDGTKGIWGSAFTVLKLPGRPELE